MSASIINFPLSPLKAWEEFAKIAREEAINPNLADDPDWREAFARAHARFVRIWMDSI